jgi:STE24 endopeptidase
MNLEVVCFILIFTYITNWKRLQLLPQAILNYKKVIRNYPEDAFTKKIAEKINLDFEIKVQKTSIINGYMPGLPIKPVMVLTQGAIDKLTKEELEWVILHEAGHCINWHTPKDLILWIIFLTLGISLINYLMISFFITILFSIVLAVLWIQLERRHEIEADKFALDNGADPKAMISFFEKIHKLSKNIIYENQFLGLLLSSHPNYKKRITMAKTYLN